jgi:transposase-like protein
MGYRKYTDELKREVLAMATEGTRSVTQLEALSAETRDD